MTDKTMTPGELADELDRRSQALSATAETLVSDFGRGLTIGHSNGYAASANLIRTTPLETEGERKLREALEVIAGGHGCPSAIARAALGDS